MYSYEDLMKAVQLYEQNGYHAAAVIRELGYSDRHMLVKWYQEWQSMGCNKINKIKLLGQIFLSFFTKDDT